MLPFLVSLSLCVLMGLWLAPHLRGLEVAPEFRWLLVTLAGTVTLHLGLALLSLVQIPWRSGAPALGIAAVLGAVATHRTVRSPGPWGFARFRYGWGDALAAAGVALFGFSAWRLWTVTSDFFYHWGAKGQKFFLAGGIDYEFLAHPWNQSAVPWYPTMLSELFGLTALLRSHFSEPDVMLWTVLWVVLLLVAAREMLRAGGTTNFFFVQAAVASLALLVTAMGLASRLAGGADWMIALALLVGSRAFLAPPGEPGMDLVVAIAAAFAAASKVEGAVLACLLIAAQIVRGGSPLRRNALKRFAVLGLPAAAVGTVWMLQLLRLDLTPAPQVSRTFDVVDVGRLFTVFQAIRDHSEIRAGYGFPLLLLLLLWLPFNPKTRWMSLLAMLQMLFYLAVYVVSAADPEIYVRTSWNRLLVHVLPTLLVGLVLLLTSQAESDPRCHPRR